MSSSPGALTQKEIRVLVADDDTVLAKHLVDFLTNNGLNTRYVSSASEAQNMLLNWKPDFILVDLFLPDSNALQFLKSLGGDSIGEDKIKVIVLSGHSHETNVRECMKLGAVDYLVKPFKYIDLLARLVLHTQEKREVTTPPRLSPDLPGEPDAEYFMYLSDLVLRESLKNLRREETLHNLTRMVAMALGAVRVSIVECDAELRLGNVRGSSDLRQIDRLELDLNKYPEILWVLNSQKLLALDNLAKDPTMAFLTKKNKSIHFNSMMVAPVHVASSRVWGVLSARMPDSKASLSNSEIRFLQIVSHVVGLTLQKSPAAAWRVLAGKKSA